MRNFLFLVLIAAGLTAPALAAFRAGASAVDISPTQFPVRVNAMFTERSADRVADPLFAKALALDDGSTRIVLCVVDSCMVPRDLIDQAKASASKSTGIPADRMLVSSTHTHSAPSAMGCLGSRVDPAYAALLPGRIADAIVRAVERLQPARVGWAQEDDWEHTFNRRWIRRPDRVLTDPFGQANVRAHMHPGHESPDAIGPSGPVDPQLSVLAVQSMDGKPLALLANYSQHYYGSPLLSSDYYGKFAQEMKSLLQGDDSFVGIMSQGTSGDLMWMDYSAPRKEIGYESYAKEIAKRVAAMVRGMEWRGEAPLRMAETKLGLAYRVPDEKRLAWAREMAARLGDKLPQSQPEIYALESIYLHERPRTELKVQALGIGELGIAALPNEVFAITGLKIKAASPFKATFNIELANGAEGYIPPPEQHKLGGYTTWAARTAGLETGAEPRISEAAVQLLEKVSGKPRRDNTTPLGPYARAILDSGPEAYWRLEELRVPIAHDLMRKHDARIEDGVALHLPGVDGRIGFQAPQPPEVNAFSGHEINRAVHFAGGRIVAQVPVESNYSAEFWFWNGLPHDARAVTGFLLSRGLDGDKGPAAEVLGIGGTNRPAEAGKLFVSNGTGVLAGTFPLRVRAWHHVVLVREGDRIRVHLDGKESPEIGGELKQSVPASGKTLFIGGRNDKSFGLEGKMDEVAIYARSLPASEIARHYQASGLNRAGADLPCDPVRTFADGHQPAREVFVSPSGDDLSAEGTRLKPYQTVRRAMQGITPGTAVRLLPGTYPPDLYLTGIAGKPDAPIWLGGLKGEARPLIKGGNTAMHLSKVSYLVLENLEVSGATGNGINCDDGGDYGNPQATHHLVFRNLAIRKVGTGGNQDGLKLSGVNDYFVLDCEFREVSAGGSGIDHVGCHQGLVASSAFIDLGNSVQCKGGSSDIEIARNRFVRGGERAINIGGSTGFEFFRPPLSPTAPNSEARDIRVFANLFRGSDAPVAFVGAVNCTVANNTFVEPTRWMIRILQETTSARGFTFLACSSNEFLNNIVYFKGSEVRSLVNIGPKTSPATFKFSNNLWFDAVRPDRSRPQLPAAEADGIYGKDPAFRDLNGNEFSIAPGSPAAGKARRLGRPQADFSGGCYREPRSIGALEANQR